MKLVYISNMRLPNELAHGLQVMQMCAAFAEHRLGVELWIPRMGGPKGDPFSYYKIKRGFRIRRIPCLDLFFLSDYKIFFWLRTLTFLVCCRLFSLFKNYDVLYTREKMSGLFFKNIVLEIHSLPKRTGFFYLRIWKRAKALMVLTGFIKERLINFGVGPDKILLVPDGVDLEKFDIDVAKDTARSNLNLPPDKKLIGYVGMLRTMRMEKGIDVAIEALRFCSHGNIFLVLVGGYQSDINFYQQFAEKLGVADKLICLGQVSHELVPLYLRAFDVLIAPFPENEHYKYFMSPLKIFEYMASGRPIITTDLPSIREVLSERSAKIVKPGDPIQLAEAIGELLDDGHLSVQLANQARAAVKEYTWVQRASRIINFISSK